MRKRGFTLIELLAVIVILAIISLIAVPLILTLITNTQKSAFKASVTSALDAVDYYLIENDVSNLPADGLLVKDLKLKNKSQFIGGTIIKNENNDYEAVKVTNGKYCVSGTKENLTVVTDCYKLDVTPPVLDESKINTVVTTKSIRVIIPEAAITEEESKIITYKYELLDGNNIIDSQTSSTNQIIFTDLISEKEYKIKITIINENRLETTKEIIVVTSEVEVPTYSVDKTGWSISKVVTITYPPRKDEFIYTYSIDGGSTWTTVSSGATANVTFTANGSVIAQVTDGVNTKTASSLTITQIDTKEPYLSLTYKVNSGKTEIIVEAATSDADSGIDTIILPDTSTVALKPRTAKILVLSDRSNKMVSELKKYFSKVDYNESMTESQIISAGYNVVVSDDDWWASVKYTLINSLYSKGINILTVGNDNYTILSIVSTSQQVQSAAMTPIKNRENEITIFGRDNLGVSNDSEQLVKLVSDSEAWYTFNYNSNTYVPLGYLERNGVRWINSQVRTVEIANMLPYMIDRLSGGSVTRYKITKNGTYTFQATDKAGNITTKTLTFNQL